MNPTSGATTVSGFDSRMNPPAEPVTYPKLCSHTKTWIIVLITMPIALDSIPDGDTSNNSPSISSYRSESDIASRSSMVWSRVVDIVLHPFWRLVSYPMVAPVQVIDLQIGWRSVCFAAESFDRVPIQLQSQPRSVRHRHHPVLIQCHPPALISSMYGEPCRYS